MVWKTHDPYQEPHTPYINGLPPGHIEDNLGGSIGQWHSISMMYAANASLTKIADSERAGTSQYILGNVDDRIADTLSR